MTTTHPRAWSLALALGMIGHAGAAAGQPPPSSGGAPDDGAAADGAGPPGDAAPSDEVRAEALIEEGVRLRRRGEDQAALERFEAALALHPTPRAQAQVALAEAALGRWVVAERHLLEALESTDDPWISQKREALGETLRTIQQRLGSIEVLGGVPDAEVRVNGRVVGTLPLEAPIRAVPGEVTLEVLHPGHYAVRRRVMVPRGRVTRETVALTPLPAEPVQTDACPAGQLPTEGHCCWPGQRWSSAVGACAGEPRCPEGLRAENEDCVTPTQGGAGGDAVVTGVAAGAAAAGAAGAAGAGVTGATGGAATTAGGGGASAPAPTGSTPAPSAPTATASEPAPADAPAEAESEPKQTGFVLTLRGVFAGFLDDDAVSPGFGGEVLLGARVSPFFSFGLFGTWHLVDATDDLAPGVPAADVDIAWTLSPGLYMRLHSGRGFAGGFLDLWAGLGVAPYSIYRIELANGDRFETTGVTLPIHFGLSIFISPQVALDLGGSFTGWFPSQQCVPEAGGGEDCRSEGVDSFWGWNFGFGFSFLL